MATQKGGKPSKSSSNMDWRDPVRSSVDVGRSDPPKDESDVSIIIVLCIAIMALTFVVAIPILGIAWMDMQNATTAAVQEIKKMRTLRAEMILMMKGE